MATARSTNAAGELSYLHSRDITYAVFCQGPYAESRRYRDFMDWDMAWYSAQDSLDTLLVGRHIGRMHLVCYLRDSDRAFETYWTTLRGVEAMDYSYALMDLSVYGRQETWEDSPAGWPQQCSITRTSGGAPAGHQCPCGRADAPSPSGRDSKLDDPMTSPFGPDPGEEERSPTPSAGSPALGHRQTLLAAGNELAGRDEESPTLPDSPLVLRDFGIRQFRLHSRSREPAMIRPLAPVVVGCGDRGDSTATT